MTIALIAQFMHIFFLYARIEKSYVASARIAQLTSGSHALALVRQIAHFRAFLKIIALFSSVIVPSALNVKALSASCSLYVVKSTLSRACAEVLQSTFRGVERRVSRTNSAPWSLGIVPPIALRDRREVIA